MSGKLIVHTEASVGFGGQEIRVLAELEHMRERGYRVALAAPFDSQIYSRALSAGIEAWPIHFKKLTQIPDFFALCAHFRRTKPYLVGTHSSIDSWVGLAAASACGVPVRFRYRHISAPVSSSPLNKYLQYGLLADRIITTGDCISEGISSRLGIPPSKVFAVPTGIRPPASLPNRDEARLAICKKLDLPSSARFIGMVAVLRRWKGQDILCRAFDSIAEGFPHHYLIIVGDGTSLEYYQSIASQLRHSRRIHFVGHQTQVFDYFRAFDLAVLSSTMNEGIPQSLLQAMFAHTPVVGTKVGGIPEIVIDRQTGLLCEPNSEDSLALAIKASLSDAASAQKWADNALYRVKERHTIQAMGDRIIALAEDVSQPKAPKQ
jgi:glycosyltransferase involved in cell wall biosynthesis